MPMGCKDCWWAIENDGSFNKSRYSTPDGQLRYTHVCTYPRDRPEETVAPLEKNRTDNPSLIQWWMAAPEDDDAQCADFAQKRKA